MLNELTLTPTENLIIIAISLVILVLLWRFEKPQDDADTLLNTEPIEIPKDYVKERYGAYIWLSNKHYN